eukprot:COSAG06_NODE_78_length_25492_cov_189.998307_2_plen_2089_part_00
MLTALAVQRSSTEWRCGSGSVRGMRLVAVILLGCVGGANGKRPHCLNALARCRCAASSAMQADCAVSRAAQTCILPITAVAGYDISGMVCSNMGTGSITCETDPTCATGYTGTPEESDYSCSAEGAELTIGGCTIQTCDMSGVALANGQLSGDCAGASTINHGTSCEFTCNRGYVSSGQAPSCTGTTLTSMTATCTQRTCGNIHGTASGAQSFDCSTVINSLAENPASVPCTGFGDECTSDTCCTHEPACHDTMAACEADCSSGETSQTCVYEHFVDQTVPASLSDWSARACCVTACSAGCAPQTGPQMSAHWAAPDNGAWENLLQGQTGNDGVLSKITDPAKQDRCMRGQTTQQARSCVLDCDPGYKPATGRTTPGCSALCEMFSGDAECVENNCQPLANADLSEEYTSSSSPGGSALTATEMLGSIQCALGFGGTPTFTGIACPVENEDFSALSGCSENECAAISLSASGWSSGVSDGCTEGLQLTTRTDTTCSVQCAPGYRNSGGGDSGTVTCSPTASPSQATTYDINCIENQCAEMTDQDVFTVGVDSGLTDGCQRNGRLAAHTDPSCTVRCEAGYTLTGDTTITCAADAAHDDPVSGGVQCAENSCAAIQFDPTSLTESPWEIVASGWLAADSNPCSNGTILSTRAPSSCGVKCNTTTHIEQEGTITCSSDAVAGESPSVFECVPKGCSDNAEEEDYAGWMMQYRQNACAGRVAGQTCPHECITGYEEGLVVCGFDGTGEYDGSFVVSPCTARGCTSIDWSVSVDGSAPTHVDHCPSGCPSGCPAQGCVMDAPLDDSAQPFVCEHGYVHSGARYICVDTGGVAALSKEPCRPAVCTAVNWTRWESFNLRTDPLGDPLPSGSDTEGVPEGYPPQGGRSSGQGGGYPDQGGSDGGRAEDGRRRRLQSTQDPVYVHDVSVGTNLAHKFSQQYPGFECAIGYEVDPSVLLVCDGDGLEARFSEPTGPCRPLTCSTVDWETGVTSWSSEQDPGQAHSLGMAATNALASRLDYPDGGPVRYATTVTGDFTTATALTIELLDSSVEGTFTCSPGYSVQSHVILNCQDANGSAVFSGQPCDFNPCSWNESLPVLHAAHVTHSTPVTTMLVNRRQLGDLGCEPGYIQESETDRVWGLCNTPGGAFEFGGCTEILCNPLSFAQLPIGATAIMEARRDGRNNCVDGSMLSRHTNKSCLVTCEPGYALVSNDTITCDSESQGQDPTIPIECEKCAPGFYSPGQWESCVKCRGLEFDHDDDPGTPCVRYGLCDAGQDIVDGIRSYVSTDEEELRAVTQLRPGYLEADDCQPCTIGKYRMDADRTGCVDCANGMVCPYEGMSRPLPAEEYYMNKQVLREFTELLAEDRVPAACVPAEACVASRIGQPQSTGVEAWAFESCLERMVDPLDPDSGIYQPFRFGETTVTKPDECTGVCAVGYERDRCAVCSQGFKRNMDACELCPEQSLSTNLLFVIIAGVALLIGLILAAVVKWLSGYVNSMRELATPALILVTFAQTLSSMLSLHMGWPPFVKRLFRMLAVFNISLAFVDPECSFTFNFLRKEVLALFLPVVTVIVGQFYITLHITVNRYTARKALRNASEGESTTDASAVEMKDVHQSLLGRNAALTEVRTMWATAFNLISIFYTTTMYQAFDCQPVREGDETEYLVVEPIVACEVQREVTKCTGTAKPVASRFARCIGNKTYEPVYAAPSPPSGIEASGGILIHDEANATNATNTSGANRTDINVSLTNTWASNGINIAPPPPLSSLSGAASMTDLECTETFQGSGFINSSGCPAGPCVFQPKGTNISAICAEAYEESSKCPEGCVFESTMEYTDYAWIRTLAIVGAVLYVLGFVSFYRGLMDNRKGFDDLLDQMKPGYGRFQLWMMFKKLTVTFVAQFTTGDVARGWFLTNMVVSAALFLQIWFRPFASAAANACETLALVCTLVVVTCGATFRTAQDTDAIGDMTEGEFDGEAIAGMLAIGAGRDMEAMAADLVKAQQPFFNLVYDVKDGYAHTKFLGDDWYLVRYQAASSSSTRCWHAATDNLEGIEQYGVHEETGLYPCTDRECAIDYTGRTGCLSDVRCVSAVVWLSTWWT